MSVNHNARYWAYFNYLASLSRLIHTEYPTPAHLAQTIARLRGFKAINRRNAVDIEEVGKLLRMGWLTELLLLESASYSPLLPYAAPWGMVQCYYAIYPSIRAYFIATGRNDVGDNHSATLRTISHDITTAKDRFPSPWCCVLGGDVIAVPICLTNTSCPGANILTLRSSLSSPYIGDPCQHFTMLLTTTRNRQIKEKGNDWKKRNGRKRLPRAERQRIITSLPETTIFNALYRMRARSNYLDVDSFLYNNADSKDFEDLQFAMNKVVFYTQLIFEFLIAKSIGKRSYNDIVTDFISTSMGRPAISTALARWQIMLAV
jgi:hypothetical protein